MLDETTNATITYREDLTEILSILHVQPDSGTAPEFAPGQFVRLGLPRPTEPGKRVRYTRRAYSIGSSPLVRDYLEFFVARIAEGELTPKLWDVEVGGRVWMDTTAKGEFSVELAPRGKDLIMVSTGTGIAPFMSMLRTYRGEGRWRRFVLINGVRYSPDLGYRDELLALTRDDPSVIYVPIVSREPEGSDWTGLQGRVQTVLEPARFHELVGVPLDPADCHVFLCGNPAMIDDVERTLTQAGFAVDERDRPGNLHFERYW